MNEQLQQLVANTPHLWQGSSPYQNVSPAIPSGHKALDDLLPGGGWPSNTLIEIVASSWGIGELRLLAPLMRLMTEQQRWLLWVCPPHRPNAPAFVNAGIDTRYIAVVKKRFTEPDKLWCIEKALQENRCGLVLAWSECFSHSALRRLQLAAESGGTLGLLFSNRETKNSPAAMRLGLSPDAHGINAKLIKARGTFNYRSSKIPLPLQ